MKKKCECDKCRVSNKPKEFIPKSHSQKYHPDCMKEQYAKRYERKPVGRFHSKRGKKGQIKPKSADSSKRTRETYGVFSGEGYTPFDIQCLITATRQQIHTCTEKIKYAKAEVIEYSNELLKAKKRIKKNWKPKRSIAEIQKDLDKANKDYITTKDRMNKEIKDLRTTIKVYEGIYEEKVQEDIDKTYNHPMPELKDEPVIKVLDGMYEIRDEIMSTESIIANYTERIGNNYKPTDEEIEDIKSKVLDYFRLKKVMKLYDAQYIFLEKRRHGKMHKDYDKWRVATTNEDEEEDDLGDYDLSKYQQDEY